MINFFNIMDACTVQTIGNVTVMILAALFTGIRMSRCKRIKTDCFECDRSLVNETASNVNRTSSVRSDVIDERL